MRFKMAGVEQESGSECLIFVDAKDDQAARLFASKKRITLAGLWPVDADYVPGASGAADVGGRATERLAGGILWFGRLVVLWLIGSAIACVLAFLIFMASTH